MRQKTIALLLSATLGMSALPATAAQYPFRLEPGKARSFYSPREALRVFVPANVPIPVLQNLKLELDNVDITEMMKRQGSHVVYKPVQPLEYGYHVLRLVEHRPDGSIIEHARWRMDVRKNSAFQQAEAEGTVELSVSRRFADKGLTAPVPSRNNVNGSMSFNANAKNPGWSTSASASFIYQSPTTESRKFNVSEFLFTGKVRHTAVFAGHHSLDNTNLVLNGFSSRGLSVKLNSKDRRFRTRLFTMRTESITGFQRGLGITQPENRTSGVTVSAFPFRQRPQRLYLELTHLNGKGTTSGTGDAGDTTRAGGRASSVVADSQINKRVRVRAEYARSRYDFDGIGTGYAAEKDKAWSTFLVYTPKQTTWRKKPLTWNLVAGVQKVGTYFRSLGNVSLPADKLATTLNLTAGWEPFNLTMRLARETDNVNDDLARPRVRNDLFNLSLSYQPQPPADDGKKKKRGRGGPRLFRQGSYTFNLSRTRSSEEYRPVGSTADVTNKRILVAGLNASFTPGKWNWSLGYTVTDTEDYANVGPDTLEHALSLNFNYPVNDRLSLTPTLQYNYVDNTSANTRTRTLQAGMGLSYNVPGKWVVSTSYTLSTNIVTDGSADTRNHVFTANVERILRKPGQNRTGWSLFMNINYNDNTDRVTVSSSANTYQAVIGIKSTLPLKY